MIFNTFLLSDYYFSELLKPKRVIFCAEKKQKHFLLYQFNSEKTQI